MAEIGHDPDEDDNKVNDHDGAHHDGSEANAPQSAVHVVVGSDSSAAVGLADSDFEDESRDGQEEDRHQVGNKPLSRIRSVCVRSSGETISHLETDIVEDLRRIPDDVALAHGATERSEQKGSARWPLVTSIVGLLGLGWHQDVAKLGEDGGHG